MNCTSIYTSTRDLQPAKAHRTEPLRIRKSVSQERGSRGSSLGDAVSWRRAFPTGRLRSQWVGWREWLLPLDALWNCTNVSEHRGEHNGVWMMSQSVLRKAQGKASSCLDPKSTLTLARTPSAAGNLTRTEGSVLIIRLSAEEE